MLVARVLHSEYFKEPFGAAAELALQREITSGAADGIAGWETPDISVVIQSKNDKPGDLERLFADLAEQDYPADVQTIVVHAGDVSRATQNIAKEYGAQLHQVDPMRKDLRPALLNEGLMVADYDAVFTTVGHAALSNSLLLRVAGSYAGDLDVGGAYGLLLPDANASIAERLGARILGAASALKAGVTEMEHHEMGILAADCSVVSKELVLALGGYPAEYGSGGADGALADRMFEEELDVVRDPLLSVHHTHGLTVIDALWQLHAWRRMATPGEYVPGEWEWHPNGGI